MRSTAIKGRRLRDYAADRSSFRGGIAVATGTGTRCQWPPQWREWRHYTPMGKLGQRHSVGEWGSEGSDNPTWSPRRKLHLFRGNCARLTWSMDLLVKRSDSSILRRGLMEYLIIPFFLFFRKGGQEIFENFEILKFKKISRNFEQYFEIFR